MNRGIQFIHLVVVGVLLNFWFLCIIESTAMAKTQNEDKSTGTQDYISDIFASDAAPEVMEEEQPKTSPLIPALLFLSMITMGTTGKHYHSYLKAQQQELIEMQDELNHKTSNLVLVETGQLDVLLGNADGIEQKIALLDKDIYIKEALYETL